MERALVIIDREVSLMFSCKRKGKSMSRINTTKVVLIILCFGATVPAYSQTIYRSTSGHIVATGLRNSQRVFVESHQSLVSLNYQNMSVAIRVDLKKLDTGVDSLNRLLRSGSGKPVTFEGKAALNNINLSDHSQRPFDLTGNLTLNSVTKPMLFKATITHLESFDNNVCLLSASGAISLRDFNLQLMGFSDGINIEIVQVALRKQPK